MPESQKLKPTFQTTRHTRRALAAVVIAVARRRGLAGASRCFRRWRGTLDAEAKKITYEMYRSATLAIAGAAAEDCWDRAAALMLTES